MTAELILVYLAAVLVGLCRCHFDPGTFEPYQSGINNNFDIDTSWLEPFSFTTPTSLEADIPVIIWWTGRLFPDKDLKQLNCPSSVCYHTSDRTYKNDPRTYAFYFYGTDLEPGDMPLPRKAHHEWALYHEESPMNNYMLTHNTMLKLFNHTATFRRESDYPITSYSIPSADYIMQRKPTSITDKNKARKEGFAPVLYAQSHCDVASDRDRFVSELMKYIEVDSIGGCLHNKDIPKEMQDPVESMDSPEFLDLISKYKFHLAFENALCKDYMTEKLFRPLHVGSVPICKGSVLSKEWMPDNTSLIMAEDFESPQALAKFLQSLDESDDAYLHYLQYKDSGIKNEFLLKEINEREWGTNHDEKPDSMMGFECYICQKISERYRVEKLHYSDPNIPLLPRRTASSNHMNCPQPYPSIGSIEDIPGSDSWLQYYWVDDYWGGLDKARALTKMIEQNEKYPGSFMRYWDEENKNRF